MFYLLFLENVIVLCYQVTYDTTGFLEKNRDLLHSNSIQLLSSCKFHLPQTFASNMLSQSEKPVVGPLYKSGGADSQKLSVSTKFKVFYISTRISFFLIFLLFSSLKKKKKQKSVDLKSDNLLIWSKFFCQNEKIDLWYGNVLSYCF